MDVSRRDFVKLAAASTVATGVSSLPFSSAIANPIPSSATQPILLLSSASCRGVGSAAYPKSVVGEDGLRDLLAWLDRFSSANSSIVEKRRLETSKGGREIAGFFVTNPTIPNDKKQIALVVLNRHGQEAGGRVVGPEILNYLVSDDAREIRDNQCVIVIPMLNPDGVAANKFNSSRTQLTNLERAVLGPIIKATPPDVMLDYHSLGQSNGARNDRGDMEVIITANTSRWGMDEQTHQYIGLKMAEACERAGWPYEVHSIDDLWVYYFGERKIGNQPWAALKQKTFVLDTVSPVDGYDAPVDDKEIETFEDPATGYTNYICAPAYQQYHTAIFGAEVNHWSMTRPEDQAKSGLAPCEALLKLGCMRFPWEKDAGYPVNLIQGDFRHSVRAVGANAAELRASRIRLWNQRMYFDTPHRFMPDPTTTVSKMRYIGKDLPLEFAICLRMRHDKIDSVTLGNQEVPFETFKDSCSTYVYVPVKITKPGTVSLTLKHPVY